MPPRRDPVPRVHSAPQWLGGLFVLGLISAGVIGAGILLWENVDIQRLTASPALRDPHLVPPALMPSVPAHSTHEFRASLFFSPTSADFFPDANHYPELLDRWQQLLVQAGAVVTRVTSVEEIDSLSRDGVLVVPSAVCLSTEEVSALRRHADRGGGLVLTWAPGARNADCEWIGWDAVKRLTGRVAIGELEQREAVYFTVPAGLPLSPGFGPATRVELRFESQIALQTTGTRVYWSDWSLNAQPVEGTDALDAAAWLGRTSEGGRIAWFGFRLGHGATPQDEEQVTQLFRNGVWWAAGVPVAEISPWPNGTRSALAVTLDVESQFQNATGLAEVARQANVPVTFFVVSQLAAEFSELAESLVAVGEIGTHTSDHFPLAGLSYADQRARLTRSRAETNDWVGTHPVGLHPPEEQFDEATLEAWRRVGGSYLIGVNEARTGSPEVFDTRAGRVVLLPRIIKNDYNVFVQESAIRSRRLTEAYLEGMAKVRALGALAVVSLRSQVGGAGGRVQVVSDVLDSARAQGRWWLASGREIADWWLSRWDSEISMDGYLENRQEVRVVAPSSVALRGAWLEVFLPGDVDDWHATNNGEPVRYARTDWSIRVQLADLLPGEESRVQFEHRDEGETEGG